MAPHSQEGITSAGLSLARKIKQSLAKNNFNTSIGPQSRMPQRRSVPRSLHKIERVRQTGSAKKGVVAQPTGSFKNRTNRVSCPLRITSGIANLMLNGSSGLPLPPPNLAGKRANCVARSCSPITNNAPLPTLFFTRIVCLLVFRSLTLANENVESCPFAPLL